MIVIYAIFDEAYADHSLRCCRVDRVVIPSNHLQNCFITVTFISSKGSSASLVRRLRPSFPIAIVPTVASCASWFVNDEASIEITKHLEVMEGTSGTSNMDCLHREKL